MKVEALSKLAAERDGLVEQLKEAALQKLVRT